ncbi:MAG: adenosylcobinamide-GDP ribazoletransferase [Ruminococcus sp.]|nr:adenosylcobinamide-GDP ribazoletransferase [Ruminococcus sp.]
MLRSLISAFLMYSRIPMPGVEWREENRRYALGFFPLVGAVIGGGFLLWRLVCDILDIGQLLFAAISVFIPIAVTGGIHLDGFCDVTDARASYADREKRLEIMSDPHIGAFAVIRLCLYLIVQTALFSQIVSMKTAGVISCGYILSRGLSGLSAIIFRSAKSTGTLHSFVEPSHKRVTLGLAAFFIIASCTAMIISDTVQGIACIAAAALVLVYYRVSSYKSFGGITGDLCGWFLQLCEIWILAAAVFSERIMEVLK